MVEQKAKLQQREAAPKRAKETRMAARKGGTERSSGIYVGGKVLTYCYLKSKGVRTRDGGINDVSPRGFIR